MSPARPRRGLRSSLARALSRAPFVDALPPRGPLRTARVLRARALLPDHPRDALAAVRSIAAVADPGPTGWWVMLRSLELTGDLPGVVAAAQEAEDRRSPMSAAALVVAVRAAAATEDAPAVARLLDLLAGTAPRNPKETSDTVRTLESLDLPGVSAAAAAARFRTYTDALARVGEDADAAAARATALAVWALREQGDPRWETRLDELLARPADWTAAAIVLLRAGDWVGLGGLAERASEETPVERRTLAGAAHRAAAEGHVTAAVRLGDAAQRMGDTSRKVAAIRVEGLDQLDTLARGLRLPPGDPVAHRPRPGSVLSVLGQSLPLRSGGYATRSHGILTSLHERGWDVAAVTKLGFPYDFWSAGTARTVPPVDVVDGIPYHRNLRPGVTDYPRYPLVDHVVESAEGITRVANEHGASLVHAASLFDVGLAGARAADRLGVPFVYEMRGLKQLLEGARFPGFEATERGRYFEMVELEVAHRADRLLVITAALGELMADLGVDPGVITVVPNGVHTSMFRPLPRDTELERRLGLEGRTVIGYVGGFVHYEGLELLLQAADRLRRERDDFHLLVVGDGAHAPVVEAEARRLGLDESVLTMPGRVPHAEVERWLSLIDIAPFPRVPMPVSELISPIKPFEAMATEKTVVVSDVAALTEIVEDGRTGRHFRKGDAGSLADVLAELLDAPAERERLGRAAREWVVAERDWSRVTDAVDGVYRDLIPPPPG